MPLLPAHPHGVTDNYIQHEVIVEDHRRVSPHEGDQGDQGFGAELAVVRGFDLAQQVIHKGGEVVFPRGLLAKQRSAV